MIEPKVALLEPEVTTDDLAKASASSYTSSEKPDDYEKLDELSSKEISTFKKDKNYIIAHRGTSLHDGTTRLKDIKADLNIISGNIDSDKLFKNRKHDTKKIIKKIKQDEPDSKIYLTGHSLAGLTTQNSLNDDYIRENVDRIETFNSASSPFYKPTIRKDSKKYNEIKDMSVHHVIDGDLISKNAKTSLIGKVKKYKSNDDKPKIHHKIYKGIKKMIEPFDFIKDSLNKHSINNFI